MTPSQLNFSLLSRQGNYIARLQPSWINSLNAVHSR